jgi:hypothetical protein
MNPTENNKLSKIIGEMSLFLLNQGNQIFKIDVEQNQSEEIIIIKTTKLKKDAMIFLNEKMSREREHEIETYGWSLMGDTELEITGLLIDHIDFKETEKELTIILKRKRKDK